MYARATRNDPGIADSVAALRGISSPLNLLDGPTAIPMRNSRRFGRESWVWERRSLYPRVRRCGTGNLRTCGASPTEGSATGRWGWLCALARGGGTRRSRTGVCASGVLDTPQGPQPPRAADAKDLPDPRARRSDASHPCKQHPACKHAAGLQRREQHARSRQQAAGRHVGTRPDRGPSAAGRATSRADGELLSVPGKLVCAVRPGGTEVAGPIFLFSLIINFFFPSQTIHRRARTL